MNGRNFRFPFEPLQLATKTLLTCDLSTPNLCSSRPDGKYITRECICTQVHNIDGDQTYCFVFTAVGPQFRNWNFAHPVHLHGHSFYVTEIGFGTYAEADESQVLLGILTVTITCLVQTQVGLIMLTPIGTLLGK